MSETGRSQRLAIEAKAALILNGDADARNAYAADLARYVLAMEATRAEVAGSLRSTDHASGQS